MVEPVPDLVRAGDPADRLAHRGGPPRHRGARDRRRPWRLPVAFGRWALAILLIGSAFALLIRFAPSERRDPKWVSAGTALVVGGWIAEAIAFRRYVTLANSRTAAGSLTMFLFVTAFFYVGSIILLVGIELDELMRRRT